MKIFKAAVCSFLFLALAGCAVSTYMLKTARQPDNNGNEVNADHRALQAAAEKILQDKGYRISRQSTGKGPLAAGWEVTGLKVQNANLGDLGKNMASNMAWGALGAKDQHLRVSSNEAIWVYGNMKWDSTWENAEKGVAILRVHGAKYEVDSKNQVYNRNAINTMDLMALQDEIIKKATGK